MSSQASWRPLVARRVLLVASWRPLGGLLGTFWGPLGDRLDCGAFEFFGRAVLELSWDRFFIFCVHFENMFEGCYFWSWRPFRLHIYSEIVKMV